MKECIQNRNGITEIGDMLFSQAAPLLFRIENPDQLHQIELHSPQIQGETAELWEKFIARDISNWRKKNYMPKDPKNWHKVYRRYRKEQAEELAQDQERLRQQMMGLQKKREQNVSKVVTLKELGKIPRDPRMRVQNGGVPFKKKKELGSVLAFTGGSKTTMVDGASVLRRARREAKEISAMTKLSRPTHNLGGGQVSRAPAAMVKEQQIKSQPDYVRVLSSKRRNHGPEFDHSNSFAADLEAREARLRQAQMSNSSNSKRTADGKKKEPVSTTLEFSDDEEEEMDDLFDELPAKKSRPSNHGGEPVIRKSSPASVKAAPLPSRQAKPSDVISQMIAKKQNTSITRQPIEPAKQTLPTKRELLSTVKSSPPPPNRGGSPDLRGPQAVATGMAMPRKKKEVDIFNRRPVRRTKP